MWSTTDVINELRNYRQLCVEIALLKKQLGNEADNIFVDLVHLTQRCKQLEEKRDMLQQWQALLPREERFIIQTHLVDGLDWAKTIVEHEKMWGVANGRSERTLKRMQAKGIERIVTCLNHMETKSFSSEVK